MKTSNLLLYAASDYNADMLYFSGVFVPDPFLAFRIKGEKIAIVSDLEYTRLLKNSHFDSIFSLKETLEEAKKFFKKPDASTLELIAWISHKYKISAFTIPFDFPAGLALSLQSQGLKLHVAPILFPERFLKTPTQARYLKKASKAAAAGIAIAETVLKHATIKNNILYYENTPLTSERLRVFIEKTCIDHGCTAQRTIVAGGKQACDPHQQGFGVLKANELIIIDVFPRCNKTGYYGDMTRTFLKGKATPEQKKLVETVIKGQKLGLSLVAEGIDGATVHKSIQEYFESSGYKTYKKGDVYYGFFHSTGHGVGLDLHEGLSVGRKSLLLQAGMVVTIEPGLYYLKWGGVRIEDLIIVDQKGCKRLSNFHYQWEIP